MSNVPHSTYAELIAGFALSSLEPEDEQILLKHLPACAMCSRELVAARETLAQLAYAVTPVDPPAALFDRIRAQVSAESPDAFRPTAPVVDLADQRKKRAPLTRAGKLTAFAAAVAIVAVGGLGAWNVALHQDRQQQGQISNSLAAAVKTLEIQPGHTVPLVNPAKQSEVNGVAVVHTNGISLVLDGFDRNDSRHTYVLWGQDQGGTPFAMTTFNVDDSHADYVRDISLDGRLLPDKIMITKESGRVAPVEPTQPLLSQAVGLSDAPA